MYSKRIIIGSSSNNLDLTDDPTSIDYLADGSLPLKTIATPSGPMNISPILKMTFHWQLALMAMGSFLPLKQLVPQLDRLANGKLPLKTIAVPSSLMNVSQKLLIIPSSQNSIIALHNAPAVN